MTVLFIAVLLYTVAGCKNSIVALPDAFQPSKKTVNEMNDDNYNYGCGFPTGNGLNMFNGVNTEVFARFEEAV